ncbi:hypothetical protein As57867_006724, partial [Aphanomyces stellatus]
MMPNLVAVVAFVLDHLFLERTVLVRLARVEQLSVVCLALRRGTTFHFIFLGQQTVGDQLKEFHTQQVDKQQLPMKKLTFEIAALLQVPNMRQDPVLVGRVRELQQQIEKLQTAQREFRQEQAFQLHLYKAERSSKFHFMSPVPSPLKKTIFKEMENSAGNLV